MALKHQEAFAHVRQLSLESFRAELQHAHEWSLSRAAKNRIREVVRFIMDPEGDKQVAPQPLHSSTPATWRFAQPGGDEAPLSEDEGERPPHVSHVVRVQSLISHQRPTP